MLKGSYFKVQNDRFEPQSVTIIDELVSLMCEIRTYEISGSSQVSQEISRCNISRIQKAEQLGSVIFEPKFLTPKKIVITIFSG